MQSIWLPNYPSSVLMSNARRPIYYVTSYTKKGKRKIPKRYLDTTKYFVKDSIIHSYSDNKPVIANKLTAGKPRYWVINFQDIYNQTIIKQQRALLINRLKDELRPYIQKFQPVTEFPVEISLELHDSKCPIDVSNLGAVYTKVIEDLLVSEGILPDDSVEYVNCSGRTRFVFAEEKKMKISITKYD